MVTRVDRGERERGAAAPHDRTPDASPGEASSDPHFRFSVVEIARKIAQFARGWRFELRHLE
jgi:hypothetical protein